MSRVLFGTDGMRGRANEYPLIPHVISRLGQVIGLLISRGELGNGKSRVIMGYDTRRSGPMIAAALQGGLLSMGIDVDDLGVCSTPGVAYTTSHQDCDLGIVISASHNPYEDNGIKLFNHTGMKVLDEREEKIEALLLGDEVLPTGTETGILRNSAELVEDYVLQLTDEMSFAKWGKKFLVDCSNGAAYALFADVVSRVDLSVDLIHYKPDGVNINAQCGSTHLDSLSKQVASGGYAGGFAFDGDADRVLFVDENGAAVDGDFMMAILGRRLKRQGRLKGNTVVGTVMSNLGLEVGLQKNDIALLRAPVGDKYVLEKMLAGGFVLGGEKSGHVINLEKSTTGDGMLTALFILAEMRDQQQSLSELASCMQESPQQLVNIKVRDKVPFDDIAGMRDCVDAVEARLGDQGRVVLRYSGTEKLARVMVEGFDAVLVDRCTQDMVNIIKQEVGV